MFDDPATRYQLLLRLNNAVINQHTPENLFTSLANEISRIFHYDRFSINLYDEQTGRIRYFGSPDGIQPLGIGQRVRPLEKGSIAQMVITSRKPVFIYDLEHHQHLETAKWLLKAGLRCVIAYPMIIRDRILGAVHFSFRKVPPRVHELREFLNDLSVQVAIAVENMISYNAIRDRSENLERERQFLLDHLEDSYQYREDTYFYTSESIARIMHEVRLSAETDAPILITGETGTGKGHIARCIHNLSPRREKLFVHVNCAALTPTLIESELFGHVRGAYTGAYTARTGRFAMADRGTIFLDEIAELPLHVQAKLLQVLQDKTFEPVGDSTARRTDFRMIAASNQDLEARTGEKTFRRDLLYRINTVHIHIPPLRDRREDIPLLINCFTRRHAKRMRRPELRYSTRSMEALIQYPWPGNVRELENIIERLMILRAGDTITETAVAPFLRPAQEERNLTIMTRYEMERRHIEEALLRSRGIVGGKEGAAALLGMRRSTLQYRMKKLGVTPRRFANSPIDTVGSART